MPLGSARHVNCKVDHRPLSASVTSPVFDVPLTALPRFTWRNPCRVMLLGYLLWIPACGVRTVWMCLLLRVPGSPPYSVVCTLTGQAE